MYFYSTTETFISKLAKIDLQYCFLHMPSVISCHATVMSQHWKNLADYARNRYIDF